MATGGPETPGDGRRGRGVDIAVWVLVIAIWIGLSAAAAWYLSSATFRLREVAGPDERADPAGALIPVAPVSAPSDADRPPPPHPAASRDADSGAVARPAWTRLPAPRYPAKAQRRGVDEGEVVLRCEALASGELGACEVLRETPAGAGFADAALASTRQARVRPHSIDGVATDSRIAFTVRFRMPPEP